MSAPQRLNKVLKELNISIQRAVEFLESKDIEIEARPNTKISSEVYDILIDEFETDMTKKQRSEEVSAQKKEEKEAMRAELEARHENKDSARKEKEEVIRGRAQLHGLKEVGKIDLNAPLKKAEPKEESKAPEEVAAEATVEEVTQTEEPKSVEIPKEEPIEEVATETPVEKDEPQEEIKAEDPPKEKEEEKAEEPIEAKVNEEKAEETAAKAKEEKKDKVEAPVTESEITSVEAEEEKEEVKVDDTPETVSEEKAEDVQVEQKEAAPAEEKAEGASGTKTTEYVKLTGIKDTGMRIDISKFARPKKKKVASSSEPTDKKAGGAKQAGGGDNKRKRKRISTPGQDNNRPGGGGGSGQGGRRRGAPAPAAKQELTDEQISKQIKETLEKLTSGGKKSKGSKFRRAKREERREQEAMDEIMRVEDNKTIEVTEFVTVSELATMMNVASTEVISACMSLGIMVTMNQRLDAETLNIVAEEFGFKTDFVDADVQEVFDTQEDRQEDLKPRAPIVTVMGHVDHGKTSLLDYVRKANVIAGESGGITQHIGAYSVELKDGNIITFLDTPGHEAFTAMRARGAQVTDLAIIVVAADDAVMPQTKEAISHAQAANVPFIIAINKVDRPTANPEKIREGLSQINVLTEDWGGKIQSQEISAKTGFGIDDLLEKVLLEAELLDLKSNPDRLSNGTVIEASLDKGRGYISTILVQNGTLRIGDYMLAGQYSGKVRALLDERGNRIMEAGPAAPASVLGLDGAPQAGDRFMVMEDEREAKQMAARRQQLQREQSVRTTKNLTLEEIGRRLAIGDFQELNIVLKGDVDGSIEALSDSLQKLSTEQVQVNIIHKAVGQISESDILLAAASNAIVVGFQVRPSGNARKLAEKEEVDVRLYSIIYQAIDEVRDAMEGLLSPDVKEEVICNLEVRETFKISKTGTVAGCFVQDGTIHRNTRIRLIRDGVVVYTGELGSLKRFKDDVKEVSKGFECGLNIKNFNDIKVGDVIEGYKEVEVKKTL
jgi:translation initiation factor IF-2